MSEYSNKLLDIINDTDSVDNLSREETENLLKRVNPYGVIVENEPACFNVMFTNWREEFLKRLMLTCTTAYNFRMSKEWDGGKLSDYKSPNDVVKAFLSNQFEFDPDRHVDSEIKRSKNSKDPERKDLETAKLENMRTAKQKTVNNKKIKENLVNSINEFRQLDNDTESNKLINEHLDKIINSINKLRLVNSNAEIAHIYDVDMPSDIFYNFTRYYQNNYEELRDAHEILFSEKPDIEAAIQPIKAFTGETRFEDAEYHRDKNNQQFITSTYTLENNKWNLLGPFKQNQKRIDFYNKDTEIIKLMFKKIEEDHKLGADMMKKRVRKAKQTNIDELGPDSEGLKNYKKAMGTLEALGAKKGFSEKEMDDFRSEYASKETVSNDEKEKMQDAINVKEQFESGDNIVVPVHYLDDGKMKRSTFQIESEEPKHLSEKEQKKIANKHIKDRHGNLMPLNELRSSLNL